MTPDDLWQAYVLAREELQRLIDNPEKHLPVNQYQAHLKTAQKAADDAHNAMMEATV
jgi:hypothetical protein